MRHDLTDNTATTINIRRGKRLPETTTVFQRGQVLLNRKGISEKKIVTLVVDSLDQIFCVIQEKNSEVPRDSLWERTGAKEERWREGEEEPAKPCSMGH